MLFYFTGRENILFSSLLLSRLQSDFVCQKQECEKEGKEKPTCDYCGTLFSASSFLPSSSILQRSQGSHLKQGSKKQWLEGVGSFWLSFCPTYEVFKPCSTFQIPFSHHALEVCVSKINMGIMSCLHKLGGISLFSEGSTSVKIFLIKIFFLSNLLYYFSIEP